MSSGVWSREEHDKFLNAIKKYKQGPWHLIAECIGTRSLRAQRRTSRGPAERTAWPRGSARVPPRTRRPAARISAAPRPWRMRRSAEEANRIVLRVSRAFPERSMGNKLQYSMRELIRLRRDEDSAANIQQFLQEGYDTLRMYQTLQDEPMLLPAITRLTPCIFKNHTLLTGAFDLTLAFLHPDTDASCARSFN